MMPVSKLIRLLVTLATATAGALLLAFSLLPSNEVKACLPCDCDFNPTLNCFGPYAAYTHSLPDNTCRLEIAKVNELGYDKLAISLTSAELAKLPETPEENLLVDEYYEIALYKLTSGEYQINVGPDADGKVYVLNFNNCPAENVRESNFSVAAE
jgi:hypothetical protein